MVKLTWNLSKSAINTYLNCPYRWYLTYIEKIETPPTKEAEIGIKVHEALCSFYDHIEPDEGSADYFYEILTAIEDDKDCELFFRNFAEFEAARYSFIKESKLIWKDFFKPIYKEEEVKSRKYKLKGYVDRIDQIEPGIYAVIDIKTGKYNTNYLSRIRRELCIYYLMANEDNRIKVPITHIGGYYPRTNDVFIEELKDVTLNATLKAIKKVKDGIKNDIFPAKPSPLCKWCGYRENCEKAWRS